MWCSVCEVQSSSKSGRIRLVDGVKIFSARCFDVPVVARFVHALKYESIVDVALIGARWMQLNFETITQQAKFKKIILIPVPLHKRRLNHRGFNQAELIAHALCVAQSASEIFVETDVLLRTRNTAPQAGATEKQRTKQLKGAFQVVRNVDPDAVYVIIDDVITTGSTVGECVRAMRQAGARNLCALTIASTSEN